MTPCLAAITAACAATSHRSPFITAFAKARYGAASSGVYNSAIDIALDQIDAGSQVVNAVKKSRYGPAWPSTSQAASDHLETISAHINSKNLNTNPVSAESALVIICAVLTPEFTVLATLLAKDLP